MTATATPDLPDLSDVREAVATLLAARATPEVLDDAERTGWAATVWDALTEGGFDAVSVPESAGGVGGSVAEACAVLEQVGAAAAPVPLAETGLLAGRLLASVGLERPDGPLGVAASPSLVWRDGTLHGRVPRIPWGRSSRRLVLVAAGADHHGGDGPCVVVVDPAETVLTEGHDLAGQPRDTAVLDGVRPESAAPAPPGTAEALALRGALSRAAMIAGAAQRVLDVTVAYTGQREQFGRPVSAFPAVAAHLVHIAEQAQMAAMAARVAAANAGPDGEPTVLDVAAAAAVASEAAGAVATAAHQATGAMGMTREFALGRLTRRLWAWREEWGAERGWHRRLGRELAAGGPDALWPTLARGCAPRERA